MLSRSSMDSAIMVCSFVAKRILSSSWLSDPVAFFPVFILVVYIVMDTPSNQLISLAT